MKVKAIIKVNDNEIEYEIPCGFGDKTFKWLAMVASQRFSLSSPNGAIRSRDDIRGVTDRSQHLPSDIYLENGDMPHPSCLLSDFIKDGDKVFIHLSLTQPIVSASGTPNKSKWETLAFTTRDNNSIDVDNNTSEDNIDDINVLKDKQSKANFMKIILLSQMINIKLLTRNVNTYWNNHLSNLFTNITTDDIINVKNVFINYWDLIHELFHYFTHNYQLMSYDQFKSFLDDSLIFSSIQSTERLYQIIYNKCNPNGNNNIDINGFLLSLIIISQKRFHDTYEIKLKSLNIYNSLNQLFIQYLRKFSIKLSLDSIIKEYFCSNDFLFILREHIDNLFSVFQKYASKSRDLPSTLKYEFLAELLNDAKLQSEMDLISTKKLYSCIKKGSINGRDIPRLENEDEFEFTFPEFVESVVRAAYNKYFQFNENDNDYKDSIFTSFLKGIEKVTDTLKKQNVEKSNKNK